MYGFRLYTYVNWYDIVGLNRVHAHTDKPPISSHFLHNPLNIIVFHFSTDPATEGDDYTSTAQQVVFQSSDSIQYVEIPITNDSYFERTEYFYADLTISAGSGSVGAPNTTTVFIIEEGENPPSLICRLFVLDHLAKIRCSAPLSFENGALCSYSAVNCTVCM